MKSHVVQSARISFFLPNLAGGGAEKISINLANEFVKRGYEVDMVLLSASGEFFGDLHSAVRVVNLRAEHVRSALAPLIRYMRDVRPDTFLACMWPLTVLAVVARRFSGVSMRLLVAEHNTWSMSQRDHRAWIRPLIRWSMRLCFPYTDGVIAVSDGASADLVNFADLDASIVKTIYNPVVDSQCKGSVELDQKETDRLWTNAKYRLLSIGTLKVQKNQALLLSALALLSQHVDAHLIILGEGQLRASLEHQAKELNIAERVTLAGFKAHPTPYFQSADLFVLSSDWEGLPTVLIEALAAGTPVVSTDCPSGPREILADGKFGRLVPVGDAAGLAAAIAESLATPYDRAALVARAQHFSIDRAVDQYLALLFPQ
jgi:glycosyltransferase involved in cell wall biosynthesis